MYFRCGRGICKWQRRQGTNVTINYGVITNRCSSPPIIGVGAQVQSVIVGQPGSDSGRELSSMLAFVNMTVPCGSRPFTMHLTAGITSRTEIDMIELLTPALRCKLPLEEEMLYVRQELA